MTCPAGAAVVTSLEKAAAERPAAVGFKRDERLRADAELYHRINLLDAAGTISAAPLRQAPATAASRHPWAAP